MTSFLGSATFGGLGSPQLAPTVETILLPENAWNGMGRQPLSPWQDGQLWPSSRFGASDANGTGLFGQDNTTTGKYGIVDRGYGYDDTGNASRLKLRGTTRDQYGNPLGSCVVQAYVTATDTFVGQTTSDASGYYELPTQYSSSTQHYLVCYLAGSPDVSGTSVNTLTPS
jgi:hypothetical protein